MNYQYSVRTRYQVAVPIVDSAAAVHQVVNSFPPQDNDGSIETIWRIIHALRLV